MFTATVKPGVFKNGNFTVEVIFSDGVQTWPESFTVTSQKDLDNRIDARMTALESVQTLELKTGLWVRPEKEVVAVDAKQAAYNTLLKAKGDLDAKLITEAEYDIAVATYKAAVSK